jgi:thioredoxin 1
MATYNRTAKDFAETVLKSDKVVLVDFWAPWCVPCQMMAPVLEEISVDADLKDRLEVSKVDTEVPENQVLAYTYQIQSIPNMKVFYKGEVVGEFIGLRSKGQLKGELLQVLNKIENQK